MTYYHGTVKEYLPSILKEGLKPKVNEWKATWPSGRPISSTEDNVIFITPDEKFANDFAKGRVKYLKAQPGDDIEIDFHDGYATNVTKSENAPVEKTTAVVLVLDLEAGENLYPDPHFDNPEDPQKHEAYCYKGVIPPERIKVLNDLDLGRHSKNAKLQGGRSSEKKVRKVRTSRAGTSSR